MTHVALPSNNKKARLNKKTKGMDENLLISVIVPIFNAEEYLDQCLTSIEVQTHRNLEIICLNDGSTDTSLEILKEHALSDDRIRIIDKNNQGYGATCNRGLSEAVGDYISIIEPDDWIEQSMYSDMIAFAATFSEEIDIIKTAYWRIWLPDTKKQKKLYCSFRARVNPSKQPFVAKDAMRILCNHPSIWSALYRREFLDSKGIRFKEAPGAGWVDNPFLIETICQAQTIIYLDEAYYCYREDTPEQAVAFAKKNTLLPLERWNDMMDILERLEVTDESVLRAQNSRGFTYLSGIIEEVDLSHKHVRDAAIHMFKRMDADLVFSDPEVSPGMKKLYAKLLHLPTPEVNYVTYIKGLIEQAHYNAENIGVFNAYLAITNYLRKRKIRTGRK